MPLILTVNPLRGGGHPETRTLGEGTISIGRGAVSDWVLADPERLLSKTHCMIGIEGSRYVLTDLSTNGVFINGAREPTARDSRVFLTDGDSFRLGDYTVTVTEVERVPAPREASYHAGSGASSGRGGDPFGAAKFEGTHAGGGGDPFGDGDLDDPFGGEPGTMFRHPIAPRSAPVQRQDDPFASGPAGRADPDDDLFAGLTPDPSWHGAAQPDNADAAQHAFSAPKAAPVVNFDDLDLDALLGDEPPGGAFNPVPPPQLPQQPPKQVQPLHQDPLAVARAVTPPVVLPPPPQTTEPECKPEILAEAKALLRTEALLHPESAFQPEMSRHPETSRDPEPPADKRGAAEAPPGDAALLAAFLEGAGVPGLTLAGLEPAAAMRAAGEVFRALTDGVREVLMSRAAIKNELRVEQTMLRARDNNALKFSVTPEEAVAALLQPHRPGYKPPMAAVGEAYRDIQSHEMAVMAGVQTALTGLLKRFDPVALEARLQPGRLDGLLPGSRKARIWELFCATYNDIAREAEDDFQSVFGREFARAYEAQMRKL